MDGLDRFLNTFFNGAIFARYLPDMLAGVWVTIWLAAAVIALGLTLGLLLACLRSYGNRVVNLCIIVFADLGRALPPLVLILIMYFGLPGLGVRLSGPLVLILVLGFVLAAFAEEIFWAGLTSVARGQWEAGRATGLGFTQTLIHVALPQAIRLAIPPLVNRVLAISKMTALGSVIGVSEILAVASTAQSFTGSAAPLTMGAIAYVIVFLPLVILTRILEHRYAWKV
ncbi:amino acid ABC transporter permease [Roseicyclus mahoneyensis]|jgi:polar amino acid transport system permease protein|uniref:Amino acid ABC transporter membrane protein 1 (PAAT family) n=1 Tax=Roseicyclus mahoneyensis TaxID=164332 RepID=A0A316GN88_9RHOB|nr:ABC transporter permease subunit [Roseicyclus mahoneyensis]PWK62364.1 amino acid ABC transporter membrane protein 1 (PAAT family) [Roseicyclus mahoneyensis]